MNELMLGENFNSKKRRRWKSMRRAEEPIFNAQENTDILEETKKKKKKRNMKKLQSDIEKKHITHKDPCL